eukprot:m.98493 g.98493  ORF g.98493 m.98493 type:complete len:2159 (+) comp36987_c0_seq18:234-6710(+)
MIDPDSRFAIIWRRINALTAAITVFAVSISAAFLPTQPVVLAVIYILDAIHLADMGFRARGIALKRKGVAVHDKNRVFIHYLKHDAVIDIVAVLPIELIPMGSKLAAGEGIDVALQWMAYFRFARIVRAYRTHATLGYEERSLNSNSVLVQFLKILLTVSVMVHLQACVWYILACNSLTEVCSPQSWTSHLDFSFDINNASLGERYEITLYWAVATSTSTGYGDIHALTTSEKWFSSFSMLAGVSMFGFILGGLASRLTNADSLQSRYMHLFVTVKEYLFDNAITEKVAGRVKNYYKYMWDAKKGVNAEEIFSELPRTFRADVSLTINRIMIDRAELFKETGDAFRRMLALRVKQASYLPGQMVTRQGDIGTEMYFLHRGCLEVLDEETKESIARLEPGDLFGEINLIYSLLRTASVCALTHCDLLVLSKSDLTSVLKHYPEVASSLKSAAEKRCKDCAELAKSDGVTEVEVNKVGDKRNEDAASASGLSRFQVWWKELIILPESRFSCYWERFVLVLTFFFTFAHPYEAAFSSYKDYSSSDRSGLTFVGGITIVVFVYVVDFIFLMDVIISYKTASRGKDETSSDRIVQAAGWKGYCLSLRFVLDMLALIPLEIVAFAWPNPSERLRFAAYFRLNRMIRWYKIPLYFFRLESGLDSNIGAVRLTKFFVYITTASHVVCCTWFMEACPLSKCLSYSWAKRVGVTNGTAPQWDYILSLYWAAATMSSTGYGDVRAFSPGELVYAVLAMMAGLMLYGYCLSTIAATSANAAYAKVAFREKMTSVREFMMDHSLNPGLIDRAQQYLGLVWRQNRGLAVPGTQRLMFDIPVSLQHDVAHQETKWCFEKVPLFQECEESFLKELALVTHSYMYSPGEYVVYAGDIGREMYLVKRGIVEVMSEDLKLVVCTIEPGGYFGEIGLMFGENRSATIRTATYCELLVIARSDLDRVLAHHPIIGHQFTAFTQNRTHLNEIHGVATALTSVNHQPSQLKPSVISALASTLSAPLGPMTRTQLATTVAASIPDSGQRELVAVTLTTQWKTEGTFLRRPRISKTRQRRRLLSGAAGSATGGPPSPSNTETPKSVLDTSIVLTVDRPQRRRLSLSLPPGTTQTRPSRIGSLVRGNGVKPEGGGLFAVQDDGDLTKRPSFITRCLSYLLMPFVLLPSSRFCTIWEIISAVAAVVTAITFSMQASFLYESTSLWVINYLLDGFFLVDIYLKFHLAYYNEFAVLVLEPLSCAHHYIRSNFVLDLISSFPIDVFAVIASSEHALAMLSLLRLNRLLKIYKLYQGFNYLESDLARSAGMMRIRFIKFLIYLLIGTHWTACAWFLIATVTDSLPSEGRFFDSTSAWLNQNTPVLGNSSISRQYFASLYWAAATTASVGYGDIRAHTSIERVFALIVMILGIVCYGYIIASVAAALANADAQRARYREKLDAIRTFMDDQDLDSGLRTRVMNYYEYLWERNRGVNFRSLFEGMPTTLQADITLSLYKRILDEVPLFQNTELGFAKLLSMAIKPIYFLTGEYVVRKGDAGHEMFFIHQGIVEVVSEDGEVVFAKMNAGQFFGEISLVYSVPRTASIRAGTNCDIFVLTKRDLDDVLAYYPHIERQIKAVAEQRRQNVRKRSEATATAQAAGASAAAAAKQAAEATKEEAKDGDDDDGNDGDNGKNTTVPIDEDVVSGEDQPRESVRNRVGRFCQDHFIRHLSAVWRRVASWNAFTFDPSNYLWRVLTVFSAVVSFLTFFSITYQAAFQDNSPAFWVVNTVFEVFFIVEMYLGFHVSYDDRGAMVKDYGKVSRRYLKTDFLWDLIPILPTLLVFVLLGKDFNTMMKAYSFIQLVRIVRVRKVLAFFDAQSLNLDTPVLLVRISKFFIIILFSTHSVACILYLLACQGPSDCGSGSWIMHTAYEGNVTDMGLAVRYCNSMYWAVATMTSTGYGDLYAHTLFEKVVISIVMVMGKLLFGFVLGNITSTLANAEAQRVQYVEKVLAVKKYMSGEKLSSRLQRRVLNYYEYLWERNKGVDGNSLFEDLPSCMKAELFVVIAESTLKKVPFFVDVSDAFMRNLAVMLKPVLFLSADCILRQEDVAQEMFCLSKGQVEEVDEIDGRVVRVLGPGSFFSEESLLKIQASQFTYRAVTPVDCLLLDKTDFDSVLVYYPQIAAKLVELKS